jgi:hypothetical protein
MSGVYLKRQTKKAAVERLVAGATGEDFSDLIQRLLEGWLATPAPEKPVP